MELTAGIGGKQRYIKRKGIPSGYDYIVGSGGFGLAPHYEYNNDGTVYYPLACRVIWELKFL